MKIGSGWSAKKNADEAVKEAVAAMQKELGGETPKFVVVFATGKVFSGKDVFVALRAALGPDVKVWGLNSDVSGVITPAGVCGGLSVMGFAAPDLVVGVGSAPLDWKAADTYEGAGKQAIEAALRDAGKDASEKPSVIFFGGLNLVTDIDIFRGMRNVVGEVPICGGNTGQQTGELVPGDGYVFSNDGAAENAVSIAALWTKSKVSVAYRYSYNERQEKSGVVTKADAAKRIIYEIGNRPAAEVFNEWIGGKIDDLVKGKGGTIPLSIIGKYELKKPVSKGSADYVAVAFLEVYPDKSVFVSHESVAEGTELTLLELGTEQDVVNNTSVVATVARNRGEIARENIAGAVLVYCYALLYTAQGSGYNIAPAFPSLQRVLGGATFTGFFSGGEIGYSPHFPDEGNRMMAVSNVIAVFGK